MMTPHTIGQLLEVCTLPAPCTLSITRRSVKLPLPKPWWANCATGNMAASSQACVRV
jgi:hypothetical protein